MDPDETYEAFLEALKDGDVEIASHRLDELTAWVRRGGFVPKLLKPRLNPSHDLARLLVSAAVVLAWAANDLNSEGENDEPA